MLQRSLKLNYMYNLPHRETMELMGKTGPLAQQVHRDLLAHRDPSEPQEILGPL